MPPDYRVPLRAVHVILLLLLLLHILRLSRHDEDFKRVDAGFQACVFLCEVFVTLLEVRDVFCCFGEDGCLRFMSVIGETMKR